MSHVFRATAEKRPAHIALRWKTPDDVEHAMPWGEYFQQSRQAGKALMALGVQQQEVVMIMGFNSVEWLLAAHGCWVSGAIVTGVYLSNSADIIEYQVKHTNSKASLAKFLEVRGRDGVNLEYIVCWGIDPPEGDVRCMSWNDFMSRGDATLDENLDAREAMIKPGHCGCLIYTSGTTAFPKAVMISHDNMCWTAEKARVSVRDFDHNEIIVSYLPLSHIAALMLDCILHNNLGHTIYFAKPDALRGSLVQTLNEVRPTVFLGVPRVYEKMEDRITAVGRQTTGLKRKIATWAKGIGTRASDADEGGSSYPWGFRLANALVLKKVRAALGFQRCRIFAVSAAPIRRQTLNFFKALHIPIINIFGMSELTGPSNLTGMYRFKLYSCCPIIQGGAEMRCVPPLAIGEGGVSPEGLSQEEGEVCFRGRLVMMGYLKNPEASAAMIDDEGWLRTGDLGKIDDDGFMYITGRAKEILVTAGGENVAPLYIEANIKKELPCVSTAMVIGDQQRFLSAFLTLHVSVDEEANPTVNLFGPALEVPGSSAKTLADAAGCEVYRAHIQAGLDRANAAAISNAQKIQKFVILPREFSVDGGELTATQKLKRRVVCQQYQELITGLYEGE